MLTFLLSLFSGPLISSLISGALAAYKAKIDAANTKDALAVDLAKAEILGEIAARNGATQLALAEQGRWYTAMIRPAFAYPLAFYYGWVVFACVFHMTMPLTLPAPVGEWSGWIIGSYFAGRSIEKVARIFANRR